MQKQKSLLGFLILVLGFVLLYSCEKVTLREPPPPVIVDSVKFSVVIKPIFSSCTGCHKAGIQTPDLKDNPYQALIDGNYVDVAHPSQSVLYNHLTTNTAHISRATAEQKAQILAWITQGAKNN
jgi:uncharacterized membrane protein